MSDLELVGGGVRGSVEYNEEDRCWHGSIQGISDIVTYEGENYVELADAFSKAVSDWHNSRR